jgi:death-on-curing protein
VTAPRWINLQALLYLHEESLVQFGGARGMRDRGLLESALARPQNILFYEPDATTFDLAAAYCFAIAKNHPFIDGNKRTAFMAASLFLALNDRFLNANPVEAADTILALVEGVIDESSLSLWFRECCK